MSVTATEWTPCSEVGIGATEWSPCSEVGIGATEWSPCSEVGIGATEWTPCSEVGIGAVQSLISRIGLLSWLNQIPEVMIKWLIKLMNSMGLLYEAGVLPQFHWLAL